MKRERGFTLPELLVVGTVLLIVVGVMIMLLRPNDYAAEKRNAERATHLASIMQAIKQYRNEKGVLPPTIKAEEALIATTEEGDSLCEDLVPAYLQDLPMDPTAGVVTVDGQSCAGSDQLYTTGYTIRLDGGRVIITAPAAEKDETIKVERWFPLL